MLLTIDLCDVPGVYSGDGFMIFFFIFSCFYSFIHSWYYVYHENFFLSFTWIFPIFINRLLLSAFIGVEHLSLLYSIECKPTTFFQPLSFLAKFFSCFLFLHSKNFCSNYCHWNYFG